MRILLLTHFFPPNHLGGTEVLTSSLATGLLAAGYDVHVVCGEDWDTAPSANIQATEDVYRDIPVRRLHFNWTQAPNIFRYLYHNPNVEHYLSDWFEHTQFDVLHITSCASLSASVIPVARKFHIPILLTATDYSFLCWRNTLLRGDGSLCDGAQQPWDCARCVMGNSKMYRALSIFPESLTAPFLKALAQYPAITRHTGLKGMLGDWDERVAYLHHTLKQVDLIVTASRLLQKLYVRAGVPNNKIMYSTYGLDTSWAKGYETKKTSHDLRLGFIGQILPIKGPDILIRAMRSLPPNLPIQLKIYGDLAKSPRYGRQLHELAQGDTRIHFLGTFENNKMGAVLSDIDVLVVPSIWYDFPLVIPSALATKTPVIATRLAGMDELVEHNVNGLLFERGDVDGLAKQIKRLLDEPDLWKRLRANIASVKTVEEMTREYQSLYNRLRESPVEPIQEYADEPIH
jgi:glycosyltransferase involved in cell wall biosynthesis